MEKIPVGLLGATGLIGQRYVELLQNHPWFELCFLASSDYSSGKFYCDAIQGKWLLDNPPPPNICAIRLHPIDKVDEAKKACAFVFSALSPEAAKLYEELYASQGIPVLSNASSQRQMKDTPLIIPEINPDHLNVIALQQKNRKWSEGFIVTKPNCSLQTFMIPLTPLHQRYQIKRLAVTTLQALTGAGYPGISSLNIIDNLIPYIPEEEEKLEIEPLKIWGNLQEEGIFPATEISISAHCNRVPVLNGHLACISFELGEKPTAEEVLDLWKSFRALPQKLELPSAPFFPIHYRREKDRPQPSLDRNTGNGMSVTVGRLRECPLYHYKFIAVSHNTIRGGAGGGILNAELLVKQGYLKR